MDNKEKVEKLILYALERNIPNFDKINYYDESSFCQLNKVKQISITGFQRILNIGYPSAKDLIEYLITNEAVTENNGRYFIISFETYCEMLAKRFNTNLPQNIYINGRINDIEQSTKVSEYCLKRINDRNKYFRKKGDFSSLLVKDIRALIEYNTEFNIAKEKILAFYDNNKKRIVDLFNINSKMIEEDSKFMFGLDYDERIVADKSGKITSFVKIYPTNRKSQEGECLCLLCSIIKMLWNKQNEEKIYYYKMFKFADKTLSEEIDDNYFSDVCINDPLSEIKPF